MDLRAGELVEVRNESEILSTLDRNGTLEAVPFTPEMKKFCGRTFKVFKRADKICVEGAYIRRMKNAVFLDGVRCGGEEHEGCKRMCLLFWKEAWLKRAAAGRNAEVPADWHETSFRGASEPVDEGKTYSSCQSTNLLKATEYLNGWDIRQYVRDIRSRSFTPVQVAQALCITAYNKIMRSAGGLEYGAAVGNGTTTPALVLNLQPGELVEVKSRKEILDTLDARGRNRGLRIDHEMLRHCGHRFRVLQRVDRIILETTGTMKKIHNTVALDVVCEGLCRRACARSSYPMWREAWLKRVG
ncbi:MAG: hypothetical protein WBW16_00680 [Bacteroidota bacterium]